MSRSAVRPLAGLALVVAIAVIFGLAVVLFRGDLTTTVPVTVISQRAGLVMNPDAKVEMRGVQVGTVSSIDYRPDGTAALTLAMDPAQLQLIPSNVDVDIASATVFGAKSVQLNAPASPSADRLRPDQVLQGERVTTEINTVFQQLVTVLDRIDPVKLNQTLGAVAQAFNGRGDQFGQSLVDFNQLLGRIQPSLPNLSRDLELAVPTFAAYGDAAPDLVAILQNTTTFSNSLVDQQRNLDQFLVSTTGLADVGTEVLGANRQGVSDVARLLVPTTGLLNEYHEMLTCGVGGIVPFLKEPPQLPGTQTSAGITLGTERYRYPGDLPKVAAKTGGANYCDVLKLPEVPPNFRPPYVVADTGSNPAQYGNDGILLNSDGLKQWLFGPLDGPPRNTAQIGQPG